MAHKLDKAQEERAVARAERVELEQEQAAYAAGLPRRPRNRRRVVTMMSVAAILVLAGLLGLLTLLPSAAPPSVGVPVGTSAPTFALPVYGGGGRGIVNLQALRGHPVLLNFWSESCPPCRAEMPYLERIYSQYAARGTFALLGINQADPKEDIAPFGREYKISYPLLFDPGGSVNQAYKVTAIPTTYFLDSQGIVRAVFVTQLSPQTMRQGLASVGISLP